MSEEGELSEKEAKGMEIVRERGPGLEIVHEREKKKTRTKRHPILGLVKKLIVYPEDVKVFYVEQ